MDSKNHLIWICICCIGYISYSAAQTSAKTFVNVTVVLNEPDVMKDEDGNYVGLVPDILEALSGKQNFDYGFYEPPDLRFGFLDETGQWNGMMDELISGKADAAALLTVTSKRAEYVDFTKPVRSGDPVIVMKRPLMFSLSPEESLTRLLLPLEFSVWLMTVLAFLVTSTVLYIISHSNPYEWRRMAKDKEATVREAESFTCLNSFWFVISTLAWQGYTRAPRSMGGRIVVTAWWFFVLLFILSYTASLTNMLRAGPFDKETIGYMDAIQNFEELANDDNVDVGMITGAATFTSFSKSSNPTFVAISKQVTAWEKKDNRTISNVQEGLDYLKSRKLPDFALIVETSTAKNLVNQDCSLFMIKDKTALTRFVSFAVKKDAPLGKQLDNGLIELYEDGTMSRLDNKWYMSNDECPKFVMEARKGKSVVAVPFHALDLGTFSGALLILVSGLVLGGLVTVIEICIFKWAETHPDDDEEPGLDHNDVSTTENLIPGETKKGGATPV